MSENDPPMRTSAPLRPPFPGGPPPRQLARPFVPLSRPGVPLLPPQQPSQQSSGSSGNPPRSMPAPPLRHIDSKGNIISGPGSFRPGLVPQITNTQMRPFSSNGNAVAGSDTSSSVSQSIIRPQGAFPRPNIPGSDWMMNRPPRPTANPSVRPPIGRATGVAGGQQPLPMRPEFQQLQRQQSLRQQQPQVPSQQHNNQQQQQQQQQRSQEQLQQKQPREQLQQRQSSQQEEDDSQKSHMRQQQQQQDQQRPSQQQPQQQQHQKQQQPQTQSNRAEQIQRPLPSSRPSNFNNNEDDDAYDDDDDDNDVVVGQAVTPLKSNIEKTETNLPRQPSLVFGESTNLQNDISKSPDLEMKKSTNNQPLKNISSNSNNEELEKNNSDSKKTSKIDGNKKERTKEGDNDSGVDESTQEKDRNGLVSPNSPVKTPTSTTSAKADSALKSVVGSRPPSATPSNKSTKSRSTSRNRLLIKTPEPEPTKKVPMNKIQVGFTPSPNLKAVRSKIGSLENATYKPGGGNVKIESKKIEIKATPRIEAKNEKYTPRGGDKKIVSTKLQWNAKSKIGSLENASHKPGGGDKKIETIKTEFRDKAKPKVGSKDNVKHVPGGGDIKIQTQKLEIKAQSKIGSLDNVKHKPGGGDKKIFDDKDYLKNIEHSVALASPPSQSSQPASMTTSTSGADENLNRQQQN